MSERIYQKLGFVIVLIIAGISLPLSIISFQRQAIINNYYIDNYHYNTTYNNNYNNTYYGNNETTHFTFPLHRYDYYNVSSNVTSIISELSFNLTENNLIYIQSNWSNSDRTYLGFYFVRDYLYNSFLSNSSFAYYQQDLSGLINFTLWNVPFKDLWHIVFYTWRGYLPSSDINLTLCLEIF